MDDAVKERIKFEVELLKLLTLLLLADITGVATVLRHWEGRLRDFLLGLIGFICIFVLIFAVGKTYFNILSKFKSIPS